MKLPALLAALLATAVASTAHAQSAPTSAAPGMAVVAAPATPATPEAPAHPLDVGLVFGFATPVGSIGVDVQYEATEWLALSGGVGLAFSGPQAAVMPRLYTPTGSLRLFAGAGFSVGNYDEPDICIDGCPVDDDGTTAVWGNLEGGIEYRTQPIFVRLTLGGGWITSDHPDKANEGGEYWLPYAGITVGGST
jgi:hypothetical protein